MSKDRSSKGKSKGKNFIKSAIKRPGALTARAKSKGKTIVQQAKTDIKSGTTLQKQQSNFFVNVLKKASKRGKKK